MERPEENERSKINYKSLVIHVRIWLLHLQIMVCTSCGSRWKRVLLCELRLELRLLRLMWLFDLT